MMTDDSMCNRLSGYCAGTGICTPIDVFPFVFTEKDYDALSSVIYNLYGWIVGQVYHSLNTSSNIIQHC